MNITKIVGALPKSRSDSSKGVLLTASLFLFVLVDHVYGKVECIDSLTCEELLRPGSKCLNGYCTNPFQSGCLHNVLNNNDDDVDTNANQESRRTEWNRRFKKRVCNSHDDDDDDENKRKYCIEPLFKEYNEIRILSQNWEGAMITSWIFQIVLSEIIGIPASIESSGFGKNFNFYDEHNSFAYGAKAYDYDALENAKNYNSDCRRFSSYNKNEGKSNDKTITAGNNYNDETAYMSCAHVMPEVWHGQYFNYTNAIKEGIIEPPESTKLLGKSSWYIPKFAAEKDPSLLSYLGLQGPKNRYKVAQTFKRPTTWIDYCSMVSTSNCSIPDMFAKRLPNTNTTEEGMYFKEGAYTGFFRATEKNDCEKYPNNCTGHITDVQCDWSTFIEAQAHHLDIPVQSDGSLEPNGGYPYSNLIEIWHAANATKSAVLMWWWLPDPLYEKFMKTDSEFTMVQLPPPSKECVTNRVSNRCSANYEDRIGNPLGSCDSEAHSLLRLIEANLNPAVVAATPTITNSYSLSSLSVSPSNSIIGKYEKSNDNNRLVERSPAYDAIKQLSVSEFDLGEIFHDWEKRNIDYWNYDARNATCQWVIDNLDWLEVSVIPPTYPRIIEERDYYKEIHFRIARWLALLVLTSIVVVTGLTYRYQYAPVMKYAQISFLYILLAGLLLVSLGAFMSATKPSRISCVSRIWFITIGYTLELAPLLVKIAALNRLMQAAERMERIKFSYHNLYSTVTMVLLCTTIVLIFWTFVDPPTKTDSLQLTNEVKSTTNETIVVLSRFCMSRNKSWEYASLMWQCLLLCSATVLAYQTRNIQKDFNESQTMAFMIYSHFVFLSMQVVIFALEGKVRVETLECFRSIIYSIDTMVTLQVYFVPKLWKTNTEQCHIQSGLSSGSKSSQQPMTATQHHQNKNSNNSDPHTRTYKMIDHNNRSYIKQTQVLLPPSMKGEETTADNDNNDKNNERTIETFSDDGEYLNEFGYF